MLCREQNITTAFTSSLDRTWPVGLPGLMRTIPTTFTPLDCASASDRSSSSRFNPHADPSSRWYPTFCPPRRSSVALYRGYWGIGVMIPHARSLTSAVMIIAMASLAPDVRNMFSASTLPGSHASRRSMKRATSSRNRLAPLECVYAPTP